jgi:hypothetical protein
MERNPLALLPPGDSVEEAISSLKRLVERGKLRALVARRRYERTKDSGDERYFLLAAQEYYYAAALVRDFIDAVAEFAAQKSFEKSKGSNSLN